MCADGIIIYNLDVIKEFTFQLGRRKYRGWRELRGGFVVEFFCFIVFSCFRFSSHPNFNA